jgi:hypothetical protein
MTSAYSRGRRALSSAEVPYNYRPGAGQQFRREIEQGRRTLPGRIRQYQLDKDKMAEPPEYIPGKPRKMT